MADKYPERNYVPMYPKGHDKPVGDGGGKGNIYPSGAKEKTQVAKPVIKGPNPPKDK